VLCLVTWCVVITTQNILIAVYTVSPDDEQISAPNIYRVLTFIGTVRSIYRTGTPLPSKHSILCIF
jgi:hypothetical protein